MRHIHTFTTDSPGIDRCTDCPVTRRNPATADTGHLPPCACGRGPARWRDGDRLPTPVCTACLTGHVAGRAIA